MKYVEPVLTITTLDYTQLKKCHSMPVQNNRGDFIVINKVHEGEGTSEAYPFLKAFVSKY